MPDRIVPHNAGKCKQQADAVMQQQQVVSKARLNGHIPDETELFFRTLIGDELPRSIRMHIWRLKGESTTWVHTLSQALADVHSRGPNDLYIGPGLRIGEDNAGGRIREETACGLLALVADIDVGRKAHAGTQYPPDFSSAYELVLWIGLTPTIIIESGHGLHLWWVFTEPWLWKDNAAEKAQVKRLADAWAAHISALGVARGWEIDNGNAFTSLLRVPGTNNAKDPAEVVKVTMVQCNPDLKYGPDDFIYAMPISGKEDVAHSTQATQERGSVSTTQEHGPVGAAQRFTPAHPCPICGGDNRMRQGQGTRCWGFLSKDGQTVFCTREEYAGDLDPLTISLGTVVYAHRLDGSHEGGGKGTSKKKPKDSHAGGLLALVKEVFDEPGNEVFHTAAGDLYATIPINHHHETIKLRSRQMRLWLGSLYYRKYKVNPSPVAVAQQIEGLEARATYHAEEHAVHVRIAQTDPDTIWIDLGTADHSAVCITPEGWTIVPQPPIRFIWMKGMLPLPVPVPTDTSLEEALRPYVNLDANNPTGWPLLLAWMCSTFWPDGPFSVLQLHGEQGSAKTTVGRVVQRLIDPNVGDLNGVPKELGDVVIQAKNSWLMPYDNFSHIQPWLPTHCADCPLEAGNGSAGCTQTTRRPSSPSNVRFC